MLPSSTISSFDSPALNIAFSQWDQYFPATVNAPGSFEAPQLVGLPVGNTAGVQAASKQALPVSTGQPSSTLPPPVENVRPPAENAVKIPKQSSLPNLSSLRELPDKWSGFMSPAIGSQPGETTFSMVSAGMQLSQNLGEGLASAHQQEYFIAPCTSTAPSVMPASNLSKLCPSPNALITHFRYKNPKSTPRFNPEPQLRLTDPVFNSHGFCSFKPATGSQRKTSKGGAIPNASAINSQIYMPKDGVVNAGEKEPPTRCALSEIQSSNQPEAKVQKSDSLLQLPNYPAAFQQPMPSFVPLTQAPAPPTQLQGNFMKDLERAVVPPSQSTASAFFPNTTISPHSHLFAPFLYAPDVYDGIGLHSSMASQPSPTMAGTAAGPAANSYTVTPYLCLNQSAEMVSMPMAVPQAPTQLRANKALPREMRGVPCGAVSSAERTNGSIFSSLGNIGDCSVQATAVDPHSQPPTSDTQTEQGNNDEIEAVKILSSTTASQLQKTPGGAEGKHECGSTDGTSEDTNSPAASGGDENTGADLADLEVSSNSSGLYMSNVEEDTTSDVGQSTTGDEATTQSSSTNNYSTPTSLQHTSSQESSPSTSGWVSLFEANLQLLQSSSKAARSKLSFKGVLDEARKMVSTLGVQIEDREEQRILLTGPPFMIASALTHPVSGPLLHWLYRCSGATGRKDSLMESKDGSDDSPPEKENVRPKFQCKVCDKKMTTYKGYVAHQRRHTGNQPFVCTVCSKRFSYRGSLQKHMAVHTNARPFSCDLCAWKFRSKSHLEEHRLTHIGTKQHECKLCKKSYLRRRCLAQHVAKEHPDYDITSLS